MGEEQLSLCSNARTRQFIFRRQPVRGGYAGEPPAGLPPGQRRCEWAMLMTAIITQMSSTMKGAPPAW
jgi:hypothetical protein